ncbi:hypothetical protein CF319_g2888 [Tilletia indica]|nr:hypothetical protein CF319_g2888 [Tilletia indica]
MDRTRTIQDCFQLPRTQAEEETRQDRSVAPFMLVVVPSHYMPLTTAVDPGEVGQELLPVLMSSSPLPVLPRAPPPSGIAIFTFSASPSALENIARPDQPRRLPWLPKICWKGEFIQQSSSSRDPSNPTSCLISHRRAATASTSSTRAHIAGRSMATGAFEYQRTEMQRFGASVVVRRLQGLGSFNASTGTVVAHHSYYKIIGLNDAKKNGDIA